VDQVVPEPAATVVAVLNSRAHAVHPDTLASKASAAPLLRALGRPDASAASLRRLRTLRSALLSIVDGGAGWDAFTAVTADARWQRRFLSPTTVELSQTAGDPLAGRLAQDVAALVESGRWPRIRICANQACGAAFYDATRSRTQRWHSYETCGNRHNVAAHRARTSG
jgi:predicted RNA-binding Zn ribbon-like protein